MTNPVAPRSADAVEEPPAPPFDPAIVDGLLSQLDKTLRAHQLYNPNNPTYIKTLEMMRAAFAPLWAETDEAGAYRRTIIKTADPDRYGIRVGDYFM